jgi:predicted GNAT family N-acyltransferase
LNFSSSPERFVDQNNELIRQQLESEKYAYLSCLQIRDAFRSDRAGVELLSKSLEWILKEFHKVRCVVEDPKLLSYYKYFGAEIVNEVLNKDKLYILIWDEKSFAKRH